MKRAVIPGYPHHVTQRGNKRQQTFFCVADYQYYLGLMAEATRAPVTEVWTYCLMPNPVHMVMVPAADDGLQASLGETHRRYTRYINFREGWRGHLWQERFHSFPMDEEYLLATVKYVELHPVKAKLYLMPQDWRWSSASAHRPAGLTCSSRSGRCSIGLLTGVCIRQVIAIPVTRHYKGIPVPGDRLEMNVSSAGWNS